MKTLNAIQLGEVGAVLATTRVPLGNDTEALLREMSGVEQSQYDEILASCMLGGEEAGDGKPSMRPSGLSKTKAALVALSLVDPDTERRMFEGTPLEDAIKIVSSWKASLLSALASAAAKLNKMTAEAQRKTEKN